MTNTTHTLRLIDEYLTQGGYTPGIDGVALYDEARLVAAAPDLLAALEDAVEALSEAKYYPSELNRLQAVIAKAKGN
jgi:hypothetical protein